MPSEYVGDLETRDINEQIDRILKELGNPEPPLSLPQVRELLKLDIGYFSTTDPSALDEIKHRLTVAGKQLLARPGLIVDVFKNANLSALWVPDSKRILIDNDTPKLKHRWIEGHEISHGIIPWHGEFLFGDNLTTLNPVCDATIEAEANYGSGRLLFLGDKFGNEARDTELSFKSIKSFAKRYGNTITSTLWRMVEEREPERAVFGLISAHPYYPNIGIGNNVETKYFIRSNRFKEQFFNITPDDAYALIERHANLNERGAVVDAQDALIDVDGDTYEFRIESFSNSHTLLTYGVCERKTPFFSLNIS
ncbi:hypothetical protein MNBD_GAMMA12-1353 [hydrothermal vent metagenome]|uniref:IrrE N-terminal-like domain-containing protein n=1 Tax=hydrothermal vent metagenome TaxID=652676 RepID=A0A3B0YGD1_9ZZZZ